MIAERARPCSGKGRSLTKHCGGKIQRCRCGITLIPLRMADSIALWTSETEYPIKLTISLLARRELPTWSIE